MKCRQCNSEIKADYSCKFVHSDDLCCLCVGDKSRKFCEHLDLLPYRRHGGATVHQNWRDSGWNEGLKQLKGMCKFCPFCGEELK